MVRLIQGGLGCGKTTRAVKHCIATGSNFIVMDWRRAKEIIGQYPTLRGRVFTWEQLLTTKLQGNFNQRVVIDDLDHAIESLLRPVQIMGATMGWALDRIEVNMNLPEGYLENLRKDFGEKEVSRRLLGKFTEDE